MVTGDTCENYRCGLDASGSRHAGRGRAGGAGRARSWDRPGSPRQPRRRGWPRRSDSQRPACLAGRPAAEAREECAPRRLGVALGPSRHPPACRDIRAAQLCPPQAPSPRWGLLQGRPSLSPRGRLQRRGQTDKPVSATAARPLPPHSAAYTPPRLPPLQVWGARLGARPTPSFLRGLSPWSPVKGWSGRTVHYQLQSAGGTRCQGPRTPHVPWSF